MKSTIGADITSDIQLNKENLINNSYKEIIYNNITYKLNSKNYINQNKIIYKCFYKRQIKTKDISEKYFCNSMITAIRNENDLSKYKFYLKQSHSEDCINQHKINEGLTSKNIIINKSIDSKNYNNNKCNNNKKENIFITINKDKNNKINFGNKSNNQNKIDNIQINKDEEKGSEYNEKIYGFYNKKIYNINQFDQIKKSLFLLKEIKIIRQSEYI